MSDNPFAEHGDDDHTVIRPMPGGRRLPSAPVAPAPSQEPEAPGDLPTAPAARATDARLGLNPLVAAATPLLALMARLRDTPRGPDPAALRERAIEALGRFGVEARASGVAAELVRPAHYALCASLDDIVLATPWGQQGAWSTGSLVSTFHQEVQSGERFFDTLAKLRETPSTALPALELMYLCLSLGFQGRYRLAPRGASELDRLREDLYASIARQRPAAELELSPHWRGVAAPYRPARAAVPIWVLACAALAIVGGAYLLLAARVNPSGDDVLARSFSAPPQRFPSIVRVAPSVATGVAPSVATGVAPSVATGVAPSVATGVAPSVATGVAATSHSGLARPPVVTPPPPPPERLRAFLQPEIDQGLVAVLGTAQAPLVRIHGSGMFPAGSDRLEPRFLPVLARIGEALRSEAGQVTITGHTDALPIHTARFPSNWHLSNARAEAAREVVARAMGEGAPVRSAGRGEAEPVATNATAEGRDENRRIEVQLVRAAQ